MRRFTTGSFYPLRMAVLTISTEDERGMQLLINLALHLGMYVKTSPPAPPADAGPPRKWAGSISKESGELLRAEVDHMRKHEWDRQF